MNKKGLIGKRSPISSRSSDSFGINANLNSSSDDSKRSISMEFPDSIISTSRIVRPSERSLTSIASIKASSGKTKFRGSHSANTLPQLLDQQRRKGSLESSTLEKRSSHSTGLTFEIPEKKPKTYGDTEEKKMYRKQTARQIVPSKSLISESSSKSELLNQKSVHRSDLWLQGKHTFPSQTSGDDEEEEDMDDDDLTLIIPAQLDSQDDLKEQLHDEEPYSTVSTTSAISKTSRESKILVTYAGPLHPDVPPMIPYPSRPISNDVFDIQELADKVTDNPRAVFFLELAFSNESIHFSHYYFRLIPQKVAAKRDCFAISSVGFITTINGKHTITTFEYILEEYDAFVKLKKLRMSQQFIVYKSFKRWRHNISFKNFIMNRENLKNDMIFLQRHLRDALLSVQKIKISLSCTTLLDASNIQNIYLETFLQNQANYNSLVEQKLHEARSLIRDVMINAAHGHLLQYGFVHDDKNLLVDPSLFGTPAMLRLKTTPDGKYLMTFSLKQEKKRECQRITRFVCLVDYIVISMLHTMMTNSVSHLHDLMKLGVHFTPKLEMLKGRDLSQVIAQPDRTQDQAPLFFLDLMIHSRSLKLVPDDKEWVKAIDGLLSSWFNVILGFKQYLNDRCFDMFISPLLGGVREDRMASDGPRAAQVIRGDKELTLLEDSIIDLLLQNISAVLTYTDRFRPICQFHVENMEANQESIVNETVLESIKQYLTTYTEELAMLDQIVECQMLGIFLLQFEKFKEQIAPLVERYLRLLFIAIPRLAKEKVEGFTTETDEAQKYLEAEPISTLNYVEFLDFVDKVVIRADELDVWLEYLKDLHDIAEEFNIPVPHEDHDSYYQLSDKVAYLHNTVDLIINQRQSTLEKFNDSIAKDIRRLMDETFQIRQEVMEPWLIDINSDSEDVEQALNELAKRLSVCLEKATTYKNYQKSCKVEVSRFEVLDDVLGEVKLRQLLWDSLVDWDETREGWLRRDFNTLNPDNMNQTLATFLRNINQFEKGLPPNHIVPILKEKVQEMRDRVPVITNLRNPNLKSRHWIKLEQILNFKFSPEETLNLKILEDIGIYQFAAEINEISGQASSEAGLESLLKRIEDTWKTLEFIVIGHKDAKDVYILGSLEEIQAALDDTNINLATIASSRHVGPIKPRVDDWTQSINLFSSTLEEWTNCQTNWLYLEPIFTAPDIQRQLPNEAKKFAIVDKSFKEIMRKTAKNPLAMPACTGKGMFTTLQNDNILLEQILKCLEAYLESKRVVFPRFYFLSNEELLEILAQTRNPHAVQPHLRKCFDAIAKLEFGTKVIREERLEENDVKTVEETVVQTTDIIAMISPENERVELGKGLKARGNVEDWLGKVEYSMFNSLWRLMKVAIADFQEVVRTKWVLRHASQIVLTVGLMMWAGEVERAIIQGQMPAEEKKCFNDLTGLAIMVRSDLHKLKRSIVTSLITLDVHARDIVTTLVETKVASTADFEWVKQLRYYWETTVDTCIARMSSARYEYGYEYLGASPRLVVTPLTDKCYLCLMGALQLDLGGAPAGPAGTGKTETTKDLAKALAIQCVVFNCSEGLDYKMMGRFFSGLAQSGAWCCFDEFNRIDIEVLSVIAQQLITIRNAKLAKVSRFMFEGREIKLIPRCAAFITMNPGYAGRTELPDNLKSAFRPMAMMVPDYGLIAEVILYSEGFESSKKLAQKMVNMYKLCSEQLSQQDHYDFGMRAVKSVLVMAGSLKRENPDISEDVVLIRALRDSNLPKFLAEDAELFQGVISDLFPGVEIPSHDYGMFRVAMEDVLRESGFQVHPTTLLKIIQLYETMIVRHGVMTVGPTGGGKTTVLNALRDTLSKLCDMDIPGPYFRKVKVYTLNPKSITMGELYGEVNLATMEWKDGLLGIFVRKAVQTELEIHQWVVCDGPVDAVWIESMNTVLDDNKMLCLTNSERIKLSPWVHMVFEVEDLSQASPATVSRCGMVYIDPEDLKFMPYVYSWLDRFLVTVPLQDILIQFIRALFNTHMESGFVYIKKNSCIAAIGQVPISKATAVCSLFQSLIKAQKFNGPVIDVATIKTFIIQAFVFAYIWGVGGNLVDQFREGFEGHIRQMFEEVSEARLPPTDLWEVYMNNSSKKLEPLYKVVPIFKYRSEQPFFDILVPTVDTERFGLLMELFLNEGHPVLFTGLTGVGKSVIAKGVLSKMSEGPTWVQVSLNFSAQTSSARTQEMLEAKMDRRKKNVLGAPMGKKMAIFVDDVNMPRPEKYGAMPPIELLRQMLDFKGFYDRDKMFWKKVMDIVLSSACAPPGGGRNSLTPRFVRHFALLYLPFPSELALKSIFKAIISGFLADFSRQIQDVGESIVLASCDLYQRISEDLLPTPAKSHYVFNLRDLSKCIQGVLQADSGTMREVIDMLRLFYHECLRVFHDRLICQEDKTYFYHLMSKLCDKYFGNPVLTLPSKEDVSEMPVLLFGDFMSNSPKEDRIYEEIKNMDKLRSVLNDYMMDYNLARGKNMKLIFFMDAIEHVCRLARVLRSERGNGLLVGVGGMGKQSLTRLGAHLNDAKTFQIELTRNYDYNSFHEDLRKIYFNAGGVNEDTVFIFTDTQIVVEEFLEDINNVLNSGEVPNLFEADEYEKVIIACRPGAKELGILESNRDAIYDYFISRVRSRLHLVLCMSPVGDAFRRRCRMFPSLVNCCTIDWFTEWPEEALVSVAQSALKELIDPKLVNNMAHICFTIHFTVEQMTHRFYNEMRRHYYVTPSSYLDLLKQFSEMLESKKRQITGLRDRIANGLKKLYETNDLVAKMKIILQEMGPKLIEKSQATKILMESLVKEKGAADEVRTVVMADEAVAKGIAEEMQIMADDAQKDLDLAMPAMEAATKALEALNKNDVNEMKSFVKPPPLVKFVMEAVCLLLGAKQDWSAAKVVLGDTNFLKKLQDYDKDNIAESMLKKLKMYIEDPTFQPDIVAAQSKAAKSLCLWVRAIDKYAKVYKVVEPKRKKVEGAEKELNQIMSVLRAKQRKLAEVEGMIAKLEARYDASVAEKKSLEDTAELCSARLGRAARLTAALADEQARWQLSIQVFAQELHDIVGNVLIAAACVAYLGVFTSNYREELSQLWLKEAKALNIPVSSSFSLLEILADPYEVRVWNTCGLPKDKVSTENAIYVTKASRWPLMIDPQEQANRWIRQMEAENDLIILKMTDSSFMRRMETAVRMGNPVLIWEVGETLDPTLAPILAKATFIQGGRELIRLGDADVEYDRNFKLYVTTKMSNPHYLPEICIQVTLVNFTVTPSGLEDQLLADVVSLERPELEKQRTELIVRINKDKAQLKDIEDKILKLLFTSEGNILDDEELIETLNISKETSAVIGSRITEAEETEEKITIAREGYRTVATRGSVLYFVVAALADIDPMYQFSLKYFNMIFNNVIEVSTKSTDLNLRLKILIDAITMTIYNNVSRGLFEKHKLVFSLLLCCSIFKQAGEISEEQWSFVIRGPVGSSAGIPKRPNIPALSELNWVSCHYLADTYRVFAPLPENVGNRMVVSISDYVLNIELLGPDKPMCKVDWDSELNLFEKMMLIKALKEEKLVFVFTEYVKAKLGKAFIESPMVSLQHLYADTSNITPLIFVLSTGSDPVAGFMRFALETGNMDRVASTSLGQGQGPIAQKIIEQGVIRGDWVFLQNCHLASSWMLAMERIVMNISENPGKVHNDFRLFLSSMPSKTFPVSVLQNSVKVTNEPPKGIRANLKRAFAEIQEAFFETNGLERKWRTMIFGLCFFHAIIQERKKFGPLGWNILYEFNDSDRECALLNLNLFCEKGSMIIPWDALEYITGEITYGGRVTDYWDQRTLKTVLKGFFSPPTLDKNYKYSASGTYYCPESSKCRKLDEYRVFIDLLPLIDDPEIFGMHENANIAFQIKETSAIVLTIIDIQPKQSATGEGKSSDEIVYELCEQYEERIKKKIATDDLYYLHLKKDTKGRVPSLTTVLLQESDRFNKLLKVIHDSLRDLKKAIKGFVVMSDALEDVYKAFMSNMIPRMWAAVAYPSVKTLGSWTRDLELRLDFVQVWVSFGAPTSFWMSGLFFPQGFMTGVLQTYARKYDYPIDQLKIDFTISDEYIDQEDVEKDHRQYIKDAPNTYKTLKPLEDGVWVHGLFLDAARFDVINCILADSKAGEMVAPLPALGLLPVGQNPSKEGRYEAPLYKTAVRAGTLSTTGHSTNFVIAVLLPTDLSPDYWILKGTALLTQVSD